MQGTECGEMQMEQAVCIVSSQSLIRLQVGHVLKWEGVLASQASAHSRLNRQDEVPRQYKWRYIAVE